MTLTDRLSGTSTAGADAAFDVFIDWAGERGFALYAAQEEAVLALAGGAHVVLATPTGSGKSLVAVAAHALGQTGVLPEDVARRLGKALEGGAAV